MVGASRNTIGIENFRGFFRLRLPSSIAKGSSRYFSTGISATQENHKKAQIIAWAIEEDIAKGDFDWTLNKYKPQSTTLFQAQEWVWNLEKLWEKYCEFMRSQLSETTYQKDYVRKFANHIRTLPSKDARNAIQIRDYLLAKSSTETTKRVLTYLSACCRWAVKSKLLPINPFDGLATDIKNSKSNTLTAAIDPFSIKERESIITAFEAHKLHKHYVPFTSFLFFTGCRPGEAIALTWQHINPDCTEILFAESYDTRLNIRKTTKTGKSRLFPCNTRLRKLLLEIKPEIFTPTTTVFPSHRGGLINASKFTAQVWRGCQSGKKTYKGIVTRLVETGEVTRYRPPYNCRHTFITECLERGVPVALISRWVGNSPEVIFKHYAGVLTEASVPEF
ncbi:tyrosine-type recombinase/integrase [Nostoc edaphicum CCNP1411]|uniref:Tyrosine-type recombinase/integrase n=1 Tax=Nostoc edaphicum CCNP1411 TaxID=1472755 RepID=A0A7D7LI40_9NOSO|nr:tyrosine-type recombinase/integrase [Nostoc edaphicum]QMS91351.1 tyrosine-type recombinase/integrase [Nostoc edaphicum CCNP1411]